MNNNSCGYPLQYQSRQMSCECTCGRMSELPEITAYAMAYVPFQAKGEIYECEKALVRGTLFPCLDKPFLMGCCK